MPKGNAVITKSKFREFERKLFENLGDDNGNVVITIFKKVFDFDEDVLTHNGRGVSNRVLEKYNFNKELLLTQLNFDFNKVYSQIQSH